MFFLLLVSVLFSRTPYHPYIGVRIGGWGGIKMASASTPSVNELALYPGSQNRGLVEEESLVSTASGSGCVTTHND